MFMPLLVISVLASAPSVPQLLDGRWSGHLDFAYGTSTLSPDECKFARDVEFVFEKGFLMVGEDKQTLLPGMAASRVFEKDQRYDKQHANRRCYSRYLFGVVDGRLIVDIAHSYYIVAPNGDKKVFGTCGYSGEFNK